MSEATISREIRDIYRVTLPLPPNMANSRMHWRTKQRARHSYDDRVLLYFAQHPEGRRSEPRPHEPLARARIRATLYVWNRMDADNLVARLKWPVDWLVRSGWLVDDGPDVLEWDMPRQEVDRKHRRVVIELEAL